MSVYFNSLDSAIRHYGDKAVAIIGRIHPWSRLGNLTSDEEKPRDMLNALVLILVFEGCIKNLRVRCLHQPERVGRLVSKPDYVLPFKNLLSQDTMNYTFDVIERNKIPYLQLAYGESVTLGIKTPSFALAR
ncbi:hypothetical protein GQ600_27405 [Phytophthora cactorum]|nr:hypothetical protein GQ600_27405 [Phytophthora cactorum]